MRLNQPRLRYGVAVVALLIAGVTAFLVGRYAISGNAPTEAQVSPSGTPEVREQPPHPSIATAMTAIAEDNNKPPFVGELNGITFVGEGTPLPHTGACPREQLRPLTQSEAAQAIDASDLNFQTDYLSPGMKLSREEATACDKEIVAVSRVYEGSNGRLLSVVHEKKSPTVQVFAPEDRLKAQVIGGRPAVLVEPIGFSSTIIFMRDKDATFWTINGDELDPAEVLKVAGGIE